MRDSESDSRIGIGSFLLYYLFPETRSLNFWISAVMACGRQMAMGFTSSLLLLFTFADTWLSAFLPLPVSTDGHLAGLDWLVVASSADGFCLFSAHFPLKFTLISDENRCYR